MSLNLLLDYDKLFFNIFKKKYISMTNKIIYSFVKVIKGKLYLLENENKINYISSHLLKHLKYYTNDPI